MERCCIESLALKGLADGFALTPEGGGWTCDRCGQYYQIVRGQWTPAYRCPRCGRVSFNPTDASSGTAGRVIASKMKGNHD